MVFLKYLYFDKTALPALSIQNTLVVISIGDFYSLRKTTNERLKLLLEEKF